MNLSILNNQYLNKLNKNKPIVLGLSGGADSMVLFHLLMNAGFKVVIAHVNHHKRVESDEEEQYITSMAKALNIPIEVFQFNFSGTGNFEAAAHEKRYEFFYDVYSKYGCSAIVTAHHGIDNLETIIMNLIRGSNLYGYGGIKEQTIYKEATVIRPLISFDKDSIYEYAKENNIKYFEDATNFSDDYLRNRIRHHIIPLLQAENPNLMNSVDNYSRQIFGAFSYVRETSLKYIKDNKYKIDIVSFLKLTPIVQKDIINYIFEENGLTTSENKIIDLLDIIKSNKPNLTYDLGGNYRFIKSYDECYVSELLDVPAIKEELNLYDILMLKGYGKFSFTKKPQEASPNYLTVAIDEKFPLIIRHRQHGDRIDIGTGHKKLKDFLIDNKVPKEKRDQILVITNNQNEILWVVGYYRKPCESEKNINLIFEERLENE